MHAPATLVTVLAVLLAGFAGVGVSDAEPFRGRVLDVKTSEPISGVVVTFVWIRNVWLPDVKRTTEEFHKAVEVVTDAQGRWTVPDAEEEVRREDVELESPALVFFKPGYVHWGNTLENGGGELFRDPTVVYMKRRADLTEEEQRDVAGADPAYQLAADPMVPTSAIPLLVKALNDEQRRRGLPPLPAKKGGR